MGLFSKLMGKDSPSQAEYGYRGTRLSLDFSNKGVSIDSSSVGLPADISVFVSKLGKPRKIKVKTGVNYSWDELGLYCFTYDGQTVNTFGVLIRNGDRIPDTNPRYPFDGELTIDGKSWQTEIEKGERSELFTRTETENYIITAGYTEFMDCSLYSTLELAMR